MSARAFLGSRPLIATAIVIAGTVAARGHAATTDKDAAALFAAAADQDRVGIAIKTKPVDARPAKPGEIIVTVIADEGKETQSKPAESGDWVVRNRCPETGNEQYLVSAAKFPWRYEGPLSTADSDGWSAFQARGSEMRYFIVGPSEGIFTLTAPWGEEMVAKPGDAMVQNSEDASDIYRVAAASFACTYEVIKAAPSR